MMGGESQLCPSISTHIRFRHMKFRYKDFSFNIDAKRLLFVAVSGAHAYGTVKFDSDLDIRAVRIPDLKWATSLARDEKGVEHKFANITVYSAVNVDVSIHNIYHFLSVLLHGNGTFLENMFEEHLHEDPVFLKLKELVMTHGISKRLAGHYFGFIASSIKDYAKTKRVKKLLYGCRAAMAGIHFFLTGRVEYNVQQLLKAHNYRTEVEPTFDEAHVCELLNRYNSEEDTIMSNQFPVPAVLDSLQNIQRLFDVNRGSSLIQNSKLPDGPKYEPFNNWLLKITLEDFLNRQIIDGFRPWK